MDDGDLFLTHALSLTQEVMLSWLVIRQQLQYVHRMHFVTGSEQIFTTDCVQQCLQYHSQI